MLARDAAVAMSRNRIPSHFERIPVIPTTVRVEACVDIDEPIQISPGETKSVEFRYISGVPSAWGFGITWHGTEEDADLQQNRLQDEPVPDFTITPQSPRQDTGSWQLGSVELRAPYDLRRAVYYLSMGISQE